MSTVDSTDNQFSISNPQVITHDFIQPGDSAAGGDTPRTFPRQVLTGNSRGIQQFGSPNLFADSGNNYFGVSKNGVQQVLMGLQPTFGEGFYVTKDGVDVSQATSEQDFIFNSNQDVFKIVKIIDFPGISIVSPTCNAGEVSNSIVNINFIQEVPFTYVPAVVGYTQGDVGTYYPFPRTNFFIFDAQRYFIISSQIFASQTAVTAQIDTFVSCIGSAGSLTVTTVIQPFKIFVLQESAA